MPRRVRTGEPAGYNGYNLNKRGTIKLMKKYYQIYLILLPAVVFFFMFHYIPMYGLTMAFRDYRFNLGIFNSPWIGFKYFIAFFNYYNFSEIIKNTLVISFFKLILYFPLPIIFALLLNEVRQKFLKVFIQTASYLPYFISWVVAVAVMQEFFGLDGIINQIREALGFKAIFFMSDQDAFYPLMFFSYVWKSLGFNSIIYFAALSNVDVSYYEAATVDGAGKLKQMWYISLPSIAPTIIMLFILSLAGVLSAGWDQIYLLSTPGNFKVSEILDTYIIKEGFRNAQFGYATSVSMFQSVIGLILIIITDRLSKKISEVTIF